MGAISEVRAYLSRSFVAIFATMLGLACATAHGAELVTLVDTDNTPTTGCTVATPNGPFDGVERRFITTVDTTQSPPRVTGITQEDCTAAPGTFGAPVVISGGGWPVGVGNGTGGSNVIETGVPVPPGTRVARIGILYSQGGVGQDAVTTGVGGGAILVTFAAFIGTPEQVPTLSDAMLVLMVLLMGAVGWRYGRRLHAAPLAVIALVMVTTVAWAAIVLDGMTGDWTGPPVAVDGVDAPAGVDVAAVYGTIEGNTLFVRADVFTGLVPSAVADTYTATSGTPLAIAAAAGVLANDARGVPGGTVTSFGGGSLGGTVTSNAAGATVPIAPGGSLSVAADGSIAYTAATGFSGAFTFSYRLGNINGTSDAVVTIGTQQAPAITSANAATFNVGTAGTFTVTATGFPVPTLSVAGALPAGVTFNPATGILSGTPAAGTAGAYPLVFTAANGVGANATQNFTLTVNQTVAITSANATTFTVGAAGTFTITTSATPVANNITVGGALPAGVTLSATSGTGTATLSGTPAAGTGGTYVLTITASNGGITPNGTQTFTLTVNQAPAITSANAATFNVGTAGTFTVTATGFPVPTLSVAGVLPAGVTFDPVTGILSGTPAAGSAGSYPLVFTAANGVGANATQNFTLTVNQTVAITSANATTFTVGAAGTFTITTSATPVANNITVGGALPAGVTLSATSGTGTATLSGTPAAGTGGTYVLTITASNGGVTPNGTQTFTLTVNEAPAITSANATTFTAGTPGSFTVTSTGFPARTYSITAGALPAGVTLDPTSGVISGTAAAGGTFAITITAGNGTLPNASQAFTLTVNQGPAFTSANTTAFQVGVAGSFNVTATGVPAPTFAVTAGTLPLNVTLSPAGLLAGTPIPGTAGAHVVTITATNVVGSTPQVFTLNVNEPPVITSANNVSFQVNVAATPFNVTATGFPLPTFSVTAGALPAGVALSAAGVLSGTPTVIGPFVFTITATNGIVPDANQSFTLTVNDPADAVDDPYTVVHDTPLNQAAPGILGNDTGTPAPTLTSVTGTGAPCTLFPCAITTTGGSVVVQSSGAFLYTPTADTAGPDSFTYAIQNTSGTDAATVTITVTNALPVVDLNGVPAGIDFAAAFTEGGGAVAIVDAGQLTVTDTDDTQLTGATIVITNIANAGQETLGVTCTGPALVCQGAILTTDITYTAATGTLEILSNAPLADYQALLRTLTYNNTSLAPTGAPRDITVTVNDGIADNLPVAHSIVAITGVNQAPVITAPATGLTPINTALAFPGTVSLADPDAGAAAIQLTLTATNGTVTLSTLASLTVTSGSNGSAAMTVEGNLAGLNAALNGMTFNPTTGYTGAGAALQIDVSDLGNTGTGGALGDTHIIAITVDSRPTVTSTIPVNGATAVSGTSTVTVNFSENVTVTGASFTINCAPGGARPFSFSGSGTSTAILTPNTALPAGATCTVTVVAAQVTDLPLGQAMAADHVFSFAVNTLPTVTSTVPTAGAVTVNPSTTITVNFSEPVNAGGSAYTLECPAATPIAFTPSGSGTAVHTLTPGANLPSNTTCSVNVVAAQITDVDGGQAMAANFPFSFTTGAPPTLTTGAVLTGTVNTPLNHPFSTTGSPTPTVTVSAGVLPAGLTLGAAAISGTPTQPGSFPITLSAANGIPPNATQGIAITINCQVITMTPAAGSTLTAPYNAVFSQAFVASNAVGAVNYTLASGTLPAGLTLSGAGVLSGTPTATGAFGFSVQATDANGCTLPAPQGYTVNVDPSASNDTYPASVVGNTFVDSSLVPYSVTANDAFPAGTTLSTSGTSVLGGTVTLNGVAGPGFGQFTYDPPRGLTGADSFTYTLTSNGRTANATVSLTVTGMLWYINNAVGACPAAPCDGRQSHPYTLLSDFNAANVGAAPAPQPGANIFVHTGGASYTGPLALRDTQRLIGQGALVSVPVLTTLVPGPGQAFPLTGGARPVLTAVGGATLTLASGNTLNGFDIGNTSPAGTGLAGTNFGTLTVDTVAIGTTGAALSLATGTGTANFVNVTSTGGTNNVSITGHAGTVSVAAGSLSGATSHAFNVNGGAGNITYGGTITSGGARSVSIINKTGGNVTLGGMVTDNGQGILLNNNTGAAIAFNAGVTANTGVNAAFTATGGGSVTVSGSSSLASTTATALEVSNTTIGAAGLTFSSISSSGGGANGIILNNTGISGGLTVNGDGVNSSVGGNGSGGTIANKSGGDGSTVAGTGIYLNNTRNVVLRRMTINGTNQNYGIRGTLVDGFTLEYSTVNGIQGTAATLAAPENAGEGAVYFGNVTTNGIATSGTFTNNVFGGGRARNLSIINTAGTLTLGIRGNTFQLNQNASDANQSLLVEARGGTVNATLGGVGAGELNTFTGAPGDNVNFTGQTGSVMSVVMRNNVLTNSHAMNVIGGGGLTLATQGSMTFTVDGNTIRGADGSAVTLFKASAGTLLSGTFSNNQIGQSGVAGSGSKTGNGIFVSAAGGGTMTFALVNNVIQQYLGNAAIYADNTGGSFDANFTITGNVASQPGAGAFAGLALTNGAPASADTINVCASVTGNDFSAAAPLGYGIIVGASGAAGGHTFRLPGYAGTTLPQVVTFLQNNNLNPGSTVVDAYTDPPVAATAFIGGAACPTP